MAKSMVYVARNPGSDPCDDGHMYYDCHGYVYDYGYKEYDDGNNGQRGGGRRQFIS